MFLSHNALEWCVLQKAINFHKLFSKKYCWSIFQNADFCLFFPLIQKTLCDVILMVQERKIPAHRVVLASASHFFNLMFTSKSFANWLMLNLHDDILLNLSVNLFILWKWFIWGTSISEDVSFCVLPFTSVHPSPHFSFNSLLIKSSVTSYISSLN